MKPVPDYPAATFGSILVIGDLHLGLELELKKKGISVPPQTEIMREMAEKLLKITGAKELLVLGDVKHSLGSEGAEEVHRFFRRFPVPFSIVPGNHDGNLAEILPDAKIHPASGVLLRGTCFLHGHALPSKELSGCKEFVISHSHPAVSFTDQAGATTKVQCWLRTDITFGKNKAKLTLVPAFNPLLGGSALNENEPLGPMLSRADLVHAKLYLLDGSYIGEIPKNKQKNKKA